MTAAVAKNGMEKKSQKLDSPPFPLSSSSHFQALEMSVRIDPWPVDGRRHIFSMAGVWDEVDY